MLFLDTDKAEREKIVRRAIVGSDRYREMKKAGASRAEIEASFDRPVAMKVFTYRGDR